MVGVDGVRGQPFDHRADLLGQSEQRVGVELVVREVEPVHSGAPQHRAGRRRLVCRQCRAGLGIGVVRPRRLALGEDQYVYLVAGLGVLGQRAARADHLVVGMRDDGEHRAHDGVP